MREGVRESKERERRVVASFFVSRTLTRSVSHTSSHFSTLRRIPRELHALRCLPYHDAMITQFAMLLSHGMSLMWCLMPRRQVTCGFFRIQLLVVLGLCVLAVLAAGRLEPARSGAAFTANLAIIQMAAMAAAACAYAGSVLWRLELRGGGTWCLSGVYAATLAGLLGLAGEFPPADVGAWGVRMVSWLSSAAVLGGATTGMLLGHWYLTAPTMSIDPLKRLTRLLFAALVLRMAMSAWGWWHAGDVLHGSLVWTWMALRWLAGILAPLVLAVMTDRILRYRNTQAATGVLFAAVILVFLGEMSAALLFAESGRAL